MTGKKRGCVLWATYRGSLVCGLVSTALLICLLFAAAILSNRLKQVSTHGTFISMLALALSALFCGILSAGTAGEKRFLHALAGEGVLFLFLIVTGISLSFHGGIRTLALDAAMMLFGAFAGSILRTGNRMCGSRRR